VIILTLFLLLSFCLLAEGHLSPCDIWSHWESFCWTEGKQNYAVLMEVRSVAYGVS